MSHHLPEGWRWAKLGEVTEILLSGVDKKSEEREIPTRLCNYMDVYTNLYITDDLDFMEATATRSEIERFRLIEDDVLLTKDSETREDVARSAVIIEPLDDVTCGYHLAILRPNSANLYGVFLSAALQVEAIHSQFVAKANGSTRFGLTFDAIHNVHIPLPPLDEQRRIAAVLRDTDSSIARVEESIAAAQAVKRGVMRRLFTYGLGDEYTETRRADFGHVPIHWQIVPLEQCAYVQTGAAKGREFNGSRVISVPYLRVANVQDGYLDLTEIKYIDIREDELDRYRLKPGDVVLTEGGDLDKLGRGFIWHGEIPDCIHQNHIFAVRVNLEWLIPEYLAYLVQSDYGRGYFLSAAKQTTNLASINSSQLKAFPLLLPEIDEQREIAAILQTHDDTIRALGAERERLRVVKRGLMQGLLSGEIRTSQ